MMKKAFIERNNMDTNNFSNKELRNIMKRLGQTYKTCTRRMDLIEESDRVEENARVYDNDNEYVRIINSTLKACSPNTQIIIKRDYLVDSEHNWFNKYFARSSYYRYKVKAIKEFLTKLDLVNI